MIRIPRNNTQILHPAKKRTKKTIWVSMKKWIEDKELLVTRIELHLLKSQVATISASTKCQEMNIKRSIRCLKE